MTEAARHQSTTTHEGLGSGGGEVNGAHTFVNTDVAYAAASLNSISTIGMRTGALADVPMLNCGRKRQ